jgi:MFS family permease
MASTAHGMSWLNRGMRVARCFAYRNISGMLEHDMFAYRSILHEPPRPAAVRESPRAPWLAVGVVCFGAFMGQLDASIVTITFPAMERDFGAPVAAVQWVSLIYLVGLVAMLAPAGRLGDAIGRKLVYTYGFAVALVTTSAPKSRMRFALGVQAGAQAIGLALGPTLGGLLTATVGWRAVYWVNVPVGLVAIVAGRYLLPRTRQFSRLEKFDWPGTLLLVGWTSALLLLLSAASGLSLPAWLAALLAALGLAGVAAFIRREVSIGHPLIPVWLLRSAPLARALVGAACGYLTLFGPLVLIPQLLSRGPGGEARTGLLLSALPLGFGLAALFGDAVLPRAWDDGRRGFAGAIVTCAVMCVSVFVPVTVTTVVPLLALAGLGLGIFVPANNTIIMRSSADSTASLLGGLVNMARGIGTTLGISLMALALHLGALHLGALHLGALQTAALHLGAGHGYAGSTQARPAFIVLTVVSAAAAAIALTGRAKAEADARRPREADPSGGFS